MLLSYFLGITERILIVLLFNLKNILALLFKGRFCALETLTNTSVIYDSYDL